MTIDELKPGEKRQITIEAKNTAGSGKKDSVTYATGMWNCLILVKKHALLCYNP